MGEGEGLDRVVEGFDDLRAFVLGLQDDGFAHARVARVEKGPPGAGMLGEEFATDVAAALVPLDHAGGVAGFAVVEVASDIAGEGVHVCEVAENIDASARAGFEACTLAGDGVEKGEACFGGAHEVGEAFFDLAHERRGEFVEGVEVVTRGGAGFFRGGAGALSLGALVGFFEPGGVGDAVLIGHENSEDDDECERGGGGGGGRPVAFEGFGEDVEAAVPLGFDGVAAEVAFDVAGEFTGGLVAAFFVFRETLEDDGFDLVVDLAADGAWACGLGAQDVVEHVAHGADDFVGESAGEHLVEDDTQGIHIRAYVDVAGQAHGLLGAGPGQAADELPGDGHEARGVVFVFGDIGHGDFGQAEIDHDGLTRGIDADVAGLEVSVDHALEVRGVDGVADFGEEAQRFIDGWTSLVAQHLVERAPGDVVHHVVETAVGRDAAVVDAHDVGVAQLPEHLHLSFEAGPPGRAGEGAAVDDLDGDLAAGGFLQGLVDNALPAAVNLAQDFVPRERVGEGRGCAEGDCAAGGRGQDGGGLLERGFDEVAV